MNSYCSDVDCLSCINFPLGESIEIKQEYLYESNKDQHIQEGLERVLHDREYAAG